jgi:hypothetical protein
MFNRLSTCLTLTRLGMLGSLLFPLGSFCQSSSNGPATSLNLETALYPRVIRTSHDPRSSKNGKIVVSVTAITGTQSKEDFYTGDQAAGFHRISSIHDASFDGGLCCGTLYELPQTLGTLAPGTLLWAGSVGLSSPIEIYASKDQGSSWKYLSDCAQARQPRKVTGGLWEPEFTMASDGTLVCFYSDETQPHHSQMINRVRSQDGVAWSNAANTVAVTDPKGRPGMPVVTRLHDNLYFMTYEMCGTASCAVFSRTSADGWNWGDPAMTGSKLVTTTGQFFEHAPTNTQIVAGPNAGSLLAIGQMLIEADGSTSKESGQVVFVNKSKDGSGPWRTLRAPVPVPRAFDNYCPNYSSSLLPSQDGKSLLEFASDYAGGICRMYYATGLLAAKSKKQLVDR